MISTKKGGAFMPKKKTEEVAEQVAETPIPAAAPAAPRRQSSEDLLELNDQERGVTCEDSEDAKWGYLAGAARRQQILTGIVSTDIRRGFCTCTLCKVDEPRLRTCGSGCYQWRRHSHRDGQRPETPQSDYQEAGQAE